MNYIKANLNFIESHKQNIFSISESNFEQKSLEVFEFQYFNNLVYQKYVDLVFKKNYKPEHIENIPFLPISFFKSHKILSSNNQIKKVFESSGTTGIETSKHYVSDTDFYNKISSHFFEKQFGDLSKFEILPLLPSYIERSNSSLVHMVDYFISRSANKNPKYYLSNFDELTQKIDTLSAENKPIIVFGVTFALLDWAEKIKFNPAKFYIIETGGMKGRKKEMIRDEVHEILKKAFPNAILCSEYGMTELLSQAYAINGDVFSAPSWMKILLRDTDDALSLKSTTQRGGINIIDLANIDSCCFVETQDLGQQIDANLFKVLGRFDHSDIRGCNLLYV